MFKKIMVYLSIITFGFADIGILEKVVDGDTLKLYSEGKRIVCRIAFIDTPESKLNKKAKRDASKCKGITASSMVEAGKIATGFAKKIFKKGKKYSFKITGQDRYGRFICIVDTPYGIYNELAVESGYAVPYWRYIKNYSIERKFRILLKDAKQHRRGLWSSALGIKVMQCLEER
ncbi:thermonuclease family protein [Nitrosophilus labii]|uniref:thermonuclease family protein n=1 Tax=Nitrosophilus labii TaxID=2706014 RepID=UPI0016568F0E|nr:thermonuclease family protein [Nitrosophilus labii]